MFIFWKLLGLLRFHTADFSVLFCNLSHAWFCFVLQALGDRVTVSPNGVVFVRREIRQGVLPLLWRSLLSSRLMVKDSLKLHSNHSEVES